MKVTTKGQVTIPQHIREEFSIMPDSEVEFKVENQRIYLEKKQVLSQKTNRFRSLRGVATVKMSTDEIMKLTRSDE
jgi:AbrB family looped-hinge helix DNA binding protein